jgi:hypothetical protein
MIQANLFYFDLALTAVGFPRECQSGLKELWFLLVSNAIRTKKHTVTSFFETCCNEHFLITQIVLTFLYVLPVCRYRRN